MLVPTPVQTPDSTAARTYVLEALAYLEGTRNLRTLAETPAHEVVTLVRRLRASHHHWAPLLSDPETAWATATLERTAQWLIEDGYAAPQALISPPLRPPRPAPAPIVLHERCPGCRTPTPHSLSRYQCATCATEWRPGTTSHGLSPLMPLDVTDVLYHALHDIVPEWMRGHAATWRQDGGTPLVIDAGGGAHIADALQTHGWDALGIYQDRDTLLAAVAVGVRGYEGTWGHGARAAMGRATLLLGADLTRDAGLTLGSDLTARLAPGGLACFLVPLADSYPGLTAAAAWGPRTDPGRAVLWTPYGLRAALAQYPDLHLEHLAPAPRWVDQATWTRPPEAQDALPPEATVSVVRGWRAALPRMVTTLAQFTGHAGWSVAVVRRLADEAPRDSAPPARMP